MDCKPWSWSCFEPRPGFMQDQDQDLLVHQDQDQDQGLAQELPGSRWVHSAASSVHWENEGTIKTKKKLLKKVKDCERSLIGSGPIKTKKKLLKKIKDCERSLILPFPVILRSVRGTH